MHNRQVLAAGIAASLLLSLGARAGAPSDASDRRDALAQVAEKLADPNPLQRMAYLETIVKRGNSLQTQLAIKTAFASDDASLRGLAMRALLSTLERLTFTVQLPAEVQRSVDAAQGDARRMRQLEQDYRFLRYYQRVGNHMQLTISRYTFPQASGTIEALERHPDTFTIAGDRLSTRLLTSYGVCDIEFAPTRSQMMEGTMSCGRGFPELTLSARPV